MLIFCLFCILSCLGETCSCITAQNSNLINKGAKETCYDSNSRKIEKESNVLFCCDEFLDDEDIDYDTEEDVIGEESQIKEEENTDLPNLPNANFLTRGDGNSTPFFTPPTTPDYVGSLPSDFEVNIVLNYI